MPDNIDIKQLISNVIDDQGARYNAFLINFSGGFQDTNLEMFKWILYPILSCNHVELEDGLIAVKDRKELLSMLELPLRDGSYQDLKQRSILPVMQTTRRLPSLTAHD
jgi:hypothetical protein